MKKVLITGIAGLLGSRLADWIIENKPEYEIVGIDDLSGGYLENVNSKVNFKKINLVNQQTEVKRLVFTSTLAVYGHGYGGIFDEEQIPKPIDPYGVAKYACEMDIQIAGEQHGLDWCIIRPHNVYGLKQNIWDKYRNVLGIWMFQYLNNEPMSIFGTGEQTRAFSFIDDSLEPLWNSAVKEEASKQIINLGGIEEYSMNMKLKKVFTPSGKINNTLC